MNVDEPRRGTRDNGLRCAGYAALADFDPRVADALLEALRDHGIAAYAAPAPAATTGYLDRRVPDRPIDRVWVDEARTDDAKAVVEAEHRSTEEPAAAGEPDFDAAWRDVLASLQAGSTTPSWPAREDLTTDATTTAYDEDEDDSPGYDPADDEHFAPPAPPPLPKLRPVTVGAIGAIVLGLAILATGFGGGLFTPIGILAILGGAASLVWNMRQGPPTDSGWDDGAVV
jgi:hypothetical protein